MDKQNLTGKVMTVLGAVEPGELGITLPHEHLIVDGTTWFEVPDEGSERAMVRHPVTMDILWWLRYHPFVNWDDLQLGDEDLVIEEISRFKKYGGKTVCEVTVRGLGRDPLGLKRISIATGLNIIMGAGYYVEKSYPSASRIAERTAEDIADEIVREVFDGVGSTGIHPGIIGEIGCDWPLTDNERKVLQAAAIAQQRTGLAINIHPGQNEDSPFECLSVVEEAGADLSRVVMSHVDRALREPSNRVKLAQMGCYVEYDLFGREGYYPTRFRVIDLPNDHQRINELKELADKGFDKQIVISQDNYCKTQMCKFGGWGYAHILREAVPVMRLKGLEDDLINTWIVDNPARLLTIA